MEQPKKYQKKPVTIEAIQFLTTNIDDVSAFIGVFPHRVIHSEGLIIIQTLEGEHMVKHGDYVVHGNFDEFYPVKPQIFEANYFEIK
jgi:hypothetical protein